MAFKIFGEYGIKKWFWKNKNFKIYFTTEDDVIWSLENSFALQTALNRNISVLEMLADFIVHQHFGNLV